MVYDAMNRLTDVYEGNVGGKRLGHYDYNVLSQRSGSVAGAANTQWSWTKGGQIAQVAHTWTGGGITFGYGYNADHQRNSLTASDGSFLPAGLPASTQSYASNTLNQYTSINGTNLAYDTRGNLTSSNGWTYSYDTENHLYRATKGSTTASYAFDALGRRASKTVNGVTTHYVSLGDQEIAEYNGAGAVQKRFVYGPGLDEPLAVIDSAGNRQYALTDALGSVVAMVDDSGALKEKYAYTGYGASISSGANQMQYLFAGRRFDAETELYYNRARMYSPGLGRFMQTDPIGTEGGINLYAYVGNDPLNFTDPAGHNPLLAAWARIWAGYKAYTKVVPTPVRYYDNYQTAIYIANSGSIPENDYRFGGAGASGSWSDDPPRAPNESRHSGGFAMDQVRDEVVQDVIKHVYK